jgi:hypothetical protein
VKTFADPVANAEVQRLRGVIDQIRTVHEGSIDQHAVFCESHYRRARYCNCWWATVYAILKETE